MCNDVIEQSCNTTRSYCILVQCNVMYKYTIYHALFSVRVWVSHYVLHIAMLGMLMTIAVSTSHTLLSLTYQYIVSRSSKYKYNRVYFGKICTKSRVSSRRCRLERAITIDHTPSEEAQTTQLSLTNGCGSLARVYNECGGRQSGS